MRVIWNAGAALVVTSLLTVATSLASVSGRPARAETAPGASTQTITVADFPHRHYASLAEHFRAANTSNDGKLTPEQAKQAGWTRVVRHFDEIDANRAGFVTLDEIHAFNISQRHGRKAADA